MQLEEQKRELQQKTATKTGKRHQKEPLPTYNEAMKEKKEQVLEKQNDVAVAKQRTLNKELLLAAIPTVLAAGKF